MYGDLTVHLKSQGPIAGELVICCVACQSEDHILAASHDVPEHSQPGSYAHLHRLLADKACAEVLRAHTDHDRPLSPTSRVRRRSDDELAIWFPDGLVIHEDPFASQRKKPA